MVWVKFNRRFRWSPSENPRATIAYKAGCDYNVRAACADAAVKAGAAARKQPEADDGKAGE